MKYLHPRYENVDLEILLGHDPKYKLATPTKLLKVIDRMNIMELEEALVSLRTGSQSPQKDFYKEYMEEALKQLVALRENLIVQNVILKYK